MHALQEVVGPEKPDSSTYEVREVPKPLLAGAQEKKCRICGAMKPLALFKSDRNFRDGKSTRCKACASDIANAFQKRKRVENKSWADRVRAEDRARAPAKRLMNLESSRRKVASWCGRNPEKVRAANTLPKTGRSRQMCRHHWSYKPEHSQDVICMTYWEHSRIHRRLIYDLVEKLYRTTAGQLLATREQALRYYEEVIYG